MDKDVFGLHCTVCGWSSATDDGLSRGEVSRQGIDHYLQTEHLPIDHVTVIVDCWR